MKIRVDGRVRIKKKKQRERLFYNGRFIDLGLFVIKLVTPSYVTYWLLPSSFA